MTEEFITMPNFARQATGHHHEKKQAYSDH
jgi:hypothetical protein